MWNQNQLSDKTTAKDVFVAEPTNKNNFDQQQRTVVATHSQHLPTTAASAAAAAGNNGNGNNGGVGGGSVRNNLGHCANSNSKDKDNYTSSSTNEATDSGFLSGPQLSEDFDNSFSSSSGAGAGVSVGVGESQNNTRGISKSSIPPVQLNIVHNKQQKKHSASTATSQNYIDSGCIDEDFEDEEDITAAATTTRPSITTTAASPQQRGGASNTNNNYQQQDDRDDDDQMILDKGVDSGVSEWFCKLTLRDPNQSVNNLGGSERTGNKDTTNNSGEMAPWEIYYQQNNEGDTQLHLACITGHVEVVAALIRMAPHPCLFNIQNDEAQTSLHLAVIYGQPKILRMLLIAGAEPTARDRHGNTPLHLACISGDTQCVKALTIPISASEINEAHRSYGHLSSDKTTSYLDCARLPADLEIRNYDGERCVHLAAQGGHIDILRHLVWFGADINAREGKSGRTSLHIAIECCNEVLANFLLEECSTLNIETETYAGLTAYQVACILDNQTMQNHLEKRGAEILTPPDSDYDSSDIETDLDDSQMYRRFGDPRYFAKYNGGNPINVA